MRVLLLGSGGREHALFWKLSQSELLTRIWAYPGNGGFPADSVAHISDSTGAPARLTDFSAIGKFVEKQAIELVVVGPEDPLVHGIVDALGDRVLVFGPHKYGATLEGSKEFAKEFMNRHQIPTAAARYFNSSAEALEYLESHPLPVVIKADGLAAGKGVTVATTLDQARHAVMDALDRRVFGDSGGSILIEEFMAGEEASVFAICDGERALPFIAAQDFKRAHDGDRGPNTGGMGAYAPAPIVTPELMQVIQLEVLDRVITGMKAEGHPFRGLLYAGLMIEHGRVRVVEFNVRFGDPETQPLMRLLEDDLLELMLESARGSLQRDHLRFSTDAAMVVVLAAEGYPGEYKRDIILENLDSADENVILFHAGTRSEQDKVFSTGGRILGVTGVGSQLRLARSAIYAALPAICVPGTFYRKDIGEKAAT